MPSLVALLTIQVRVHFPNIMRRAAAVQFKFRLVILVVVNLWPFDPEAFKEKSRRNQIKMIEIKLSQGAKPGHGGMLMAPKVTPEIAETRGIPGIKIVFLLLIIPSFPPMNC